MLVLNRKSKKEIPVKVVARGTQMKPPALDANESAAYLSLRPLRSIHLQRYGLALLSVGIALGLALLLEHFHFRVPSALLLLFAVALSSWRGGRGPAVLAAILSIITFYWYFVEPVRTIHIYSSEIPYFITFVSFAALLSWFGTIRRRVEADLREQAALLNLTHDTVFVMDMEGVIKYWNRGAEERYGWTAEQALGRGVHDLLKTVFPAPLEEIKAKMTRTGRWEGELLHTKKDGTQVVVASRWALQRGEQGAPVAILETSNDITERKRAEERIQQQQIELQQILDITPQLVAVFGTDRKRLYANRPTLDYFGVSLEEWQSIPDRFWFFHPDDQERVARDVYTGPASDVPHEFEARLRRRDGLYRWFLFRGNPLRDEQGCVMRWYLTATDIEDRKRAEEERQARVWFLESMDRINRAMQGTNDLEQMTGDVIEAMLSIFDSERAFLYYPCDPNAPSFELVMDRTRLEYPGARGVIPMTPDTARGFQIVRGSRGVVTFGPGCDHPLIGDFVERFGHKSSIGIALYPKTGKPWVLAMHQYSYPRVWTPDEKKLLEEIAWRMTDSLTGLLMFRSLRESEQALRQSEAYLAEAQRLAHTGSWAWDPGTDAYGHWSEEMFRMFGFDPQEGLPTREAVIRQILSEDRTRVEESFQKSRREKVDTNDEYRIALPDGTVKHIHMIRHPILNEAGDLVKLVGTSVDITERKRAEQALQDSEGNLNRAQEIAHIGSWHLDTARNQLTWSNEVYRIFDRSRDEALTYEAFLDMVYSEDRERLDRAWAAALQGAPYDIEHRILAGDELKWVRERAEVEFDPQGNAVRGIGTVQDITERKCAEEALRESETRFRTFVDHATDAFFLIGDLGRVLDVNRQACESLGHTREELIGMTTRDFDAKADDVFLQWIGNRLDAGVDCTFETHHRRKDGTLFPVEVRAHPFWRGGRRLSLSLARDITERKRVEEALRVSNAYNRSLIETSVDPLVTIGPDGKITDVNAATEAATGRSRSELIGTDFCDYFTEPAQARAGYEHAFREGLVRDYPLELRHRDGHVISVLYNASVYRDESGQVVGVFAAARDITDRKRAEEALRLSNAYNRSLIETSVDPLVTIGPDGKITDVNAATEAATGRSRSELIGTDFCDYFTEPAQARAGYQQVFREGLVRDYPLELRHRDGRVMSVLYNASVYRDESDQVSGVFAAARDITGRKRAEEALRESETRFRTFVDHAAEDFFMLDFEEGTILDVNRPACESLGYTREELIGMNPMDFDVDLDRPTLESMAERAAAGETVFFDRHWHRRKDGTLFPVEVHTSLFWHGGRRLLLKVARDISYRLRAEQQRDRLRQLEADLAHINRVSMMGELAASVAHEVNQPLSGVVSNASAGLRWLAGDVPNLEEAREGLRRIVRDGKRAGEVIARIRALTRKAATPTEKLDLNETIREVLALVGDEAKRRSVIIRTQFADDLSPVSGDRVQLQQVVLNLVMNAIEAMSVVDERARALAISTRNIDPDQVQVTVQDSGTGIDPQIIDRIFDSFYTTKPGGMGMGLSISRSIVQAHGGRIWATANDGQGTIVHFTIPKYHQEESNAGVAGV